MIHRSHRRSRGLLGPCGLGALSLALVAGLSTGCFRATGVPTSSITAEEIPATGGARVKGLKSEAGPGDYYLGNDFVQLAVDGTPWGGQEEALAGAVSGGSIVDAGIISLDTNYQRVSMPTDALERLTPVVNQDPRIPLVFTSFVPFNDGENSRIEMHGYVYDPEGLVVPGSHGADGRLLDVEVIHTISLARLESHFKIQTQIINRGSSAVGVQSIGDALIQRSGGYRALVPAFEDQSGNPVSGWGVDMDGCDFTAPLASSVKAPMVGFMGAEPTGDSFDCHGSLGLLPVDAEHLLVAADAQHALTENRPIFVHKVVVGGLPVASIAGGATLTHNRRLYMVGGRSVETNHASQATGLFNLMMSARANLRSEDLGYFSYNTYGSASWAGPVQSEVRFERNVGTGASPVWKTERVEWQEPPENPFTFSYVLNVLLPVGTYRMSVRNRAVASPLVVTELINVNNEDRPDLPGPIAVTKDTPFMATSPYAPTEKNYLCPERAQILSTLSGTPTHSLFHPYAFSSRSTADVDEADLQPLRITLFNGQAQGFAAGLASWDKIDMPRFRRLGSYFDVTTRKKQPTSGYYGEYAFQAGDTIFGSAFLNGVSTYLPSGSYRALASRGPLSYLQDKDFETADGETAMSHAFIMSPTTLPTGWTSFDIPGPSLATTGGYHPAELLTSALAEGVQIVARTEDDTYIDADAVYDNYARDFHYSSVFSSDQLTQVGSDPLVVGARSSNLADCGHVTALFTPAPTNQRRGGARSSKGWTLADFLAQGGGQFNVLHRPRGPEGFFTFLNAQEPGIPLVQTTLWNATGSHSLNRKNGEFDALELIRADFPDPATGLPLDLGIAANANGWFSEFLQVRADWFSILNQQAPTAFTKALGCSSAQYSRDTPVGLARTYIRAINISQAQIYGVLKALQSGAAVASTGPLLDVKVGTAGPGSLVSGSSTVSLTVNLYAPDWVPVEEVRVMVNGSLARSINPATELTASTTDARLRTGTFSVTMPSDGWIVVEAGVPLGTTGAYRPGTNWARIMKGIYPIAVTNPIFVDTTGNGYTPPGIQD